MGNKAVKFRHYKISSMEFENKMKQSTSMQLENKFSYNVKYGKDNHCVGELSVTVQNRENPNDFRLSVVINGLFELDAPVSDENFKYTVHFETYHTLFPYMRAAMSQITAMAGIPPIILQDIDIENQDIYKIKLPNNEDK